MLVTGNEQVWRTVFNKSISQDAWIHLEANKMLCSDTVCVGIVTMYNVTQIVEMCKFLVMPLILGPPGKEWYWKPRMEGTHIDITNKTHDLSLCTQTLEGKICKLQSAVYEPCLLQNGINLCKWVVLPLSYKMMMEVVPQEVCVVTNTAIVPGMIVPFSGCLRNLSSIIWENETFILYPDQEQFVIEHWKPLNFSISTWDF